MSTRYLDTVKKCVFRNQYGLGGSPSVPDTVNLEYYPLKNVGDTLGPVVVEWILKERGIDPKKKVSATRHLLSVGSVAGFGLFDATVWGSGILNQTIEPAIRKKKKFLHRKLDIRAVRGPLTRRVLMNCGYECPAVYGDPAILLPKIYHPGTVKKEYPCSVILHYRTCVAGKQGSTGYDHSLNVDAVLQKYPDLHFIDPATTDHKSFVNELLASSYIVSSSLHGIILAEAYGIPTAFFNYGMDAQPTKFFDWYQSTGRELHGFRELEEALAAAPPAVPDLSGLQNGLLESFPADLWEEG